MGVRFDRLDKNLPQDTLLNHPARRSILVPPPLRRWSWRRQILLLPLFLARGLCRSRIVRLFQRPRTGLRLPRACAVTYPPPRPLTSLHRPSGLPSRASSAGPGPDAEEFVAVRPSARFDFVA